MTTTTTTTTKGPSTTTTTTTTNEQIHLNEFLDTFSLSRAERLMYDKIHAKETGTKTMAEWSGLTKLSKSKPSNK